MPADRRHEFEPRVHSTAKPKRVPPRAGDWRAHDDGFSNRSAGRRAPMPPNQRCDAAHAQAGVNQPHPRPLASAPIHSRHRFVPSASRENSQSEYDERQERSPRAPRTASGPKKSNPPKKKPASRGLLQHTKPPARPRGIASDRIAVSRAARWRGRRSRSAPHPTRERSQHPPDREIDTNTCCHRGGSVPVHGERAEGPPAARCRSPT